MELPKDLYYTLNHEWLKIDDQNKKVVYIGITDYLQKQLGDIIEVKINDFFKRELDQNDLIGYIESIKSEITFNLPITSKIIEFNEDLINTPEFLNSDPYGEGWILKVKITNQKELEGLLFLDDYKEHICYYE